ncbi:MAG: threonine synthase [Lentisphaeria bacterium]|jgi:threonine synthase
MIASTYISTRGGIAPISFRDAVMMGLADDGGLLLPAAIPDVRDRLAGWHSLPYPELAVEVMRPFIGESLAEADLRDLVHRSYATFRDPAVVPVKPVGPLFIAELFHGPTLAFKDVALQFLGNLFEHYLRQSGETLNILGATSGDTGSAAIHGVRGKQGIQIFVMHPKGRVSPLQERQMTCVLDPNVHNIAIEGTFDDGQRVLKEIFTDLPFKQRHRLGAVNSVNWARVLAQTVYYFWGAFRVQEATGAARVQVAVPTGNFGDIFAGYLAQRMGAPIKRLILATNENDILTRFFTTGEYRLGQVMPTLSPSMDIQVASNFERYLYYRCGAEPARVRELMAQFAREQRLTVAGTDPLFAAGTATTAGTLAAIRQTHRAAGYLLDPHTAVAVTVAERFPDREAPTLCLATAHPAKFPDAIRQALGRDGLAHHPALDQLLDQPTRCTTLHPDKDTIEQFIVATVDKSHT